MGGFHQLFAGNDQSNSQQDRHQLINTDKKAISELTMGASEAFTGNPLKAMRHRRKKQFVTETTNRKGQKIATEKGILELVDEFKPNQDEEEFSPNNSLDSYEGENYEIDPED